MKIYEALKEMMLNGKTIKRKKIQTWQSDKSYRVGKVDWQKEGVILEKIGDKWKPDSFFIPSGELYTEWEIEEENHEEDIKFD